MAVVMVLAAKSLGDGIQHNEPKEVRQQLIEHQAGYYGDDQVDQVVFRVGFEHSTDFCKKWSACSPGGQEHGLMTPYGDDEVVQGVKIARRAHSGEIPATQRDSSELNARVRPHHPLHTARTAPPRHEPEQDYGAVVQRAEVVVQWGSVRCSELFSTCVNRILPAR